MSLGEADAKFPAQSSNAIPPSPSQGNPGQVYPKSDPQLAPAGSTPGTGGEHEPTTIIGNPFALEKVFANLDQALNEVISTIEREEHDMGSASNERVMLQKFKVWRMELDHLRAGNHRLHADPITTPQEGGMFTD